MAAVAGRQRAFGSEVVAPVSDGKTTLPSRPETRIPSSLVAAVEPVQTALAREPTAETADSVVEVLCVLCGDQDVHSQLRTLTRALKKEISFKN
jgi:hypothetical protein